LVFKGSIDNIRGDGTQLHDDSFNKSEFCTSLFLPSLSFQSSRRRTRHIFRNSEDLSNSVLESLVERLYPDRNGTIMLATWNLLPLLAGSAIFSMPFTVAIGGYFALVFMVLMSMMADITGVLLIDCLYEVSPNSRNRKRVRKDLADIARAVWGRVGAIIVHSIHIAYSILGNVINILLLAKSVYTLLHSCTKLSFVTLSCLFSIIVYPTLFIQKLTVLAYLSLMSVISIIFGTVALIAVFFKEKNEWAHNYSVIPFLDFERFPLVVGIIMYSCISHSVLPQVEGSMANPNESSTVIHVTYLFSTILKLFVGVFGALTFGLQTESLVTLNAGHINEITKIVLGVSSIGYAVLNYPLNMFIVCETIDKMITGTKFETTKRLYYLWVAASRFVLFAMTVVVALAFPYFGILLAIRGSLIGTCLIFVFPCYFHLKLKWKQLGWFQKFVEIWLLVLGIGMGAISFYVSIASLVIAVETGIEK